MHPAQSTVVASGRLGTRRSAQRSYSPEEERVHCLSHAVGLLGSLCGVVALLRAAANTALSTRVGCSIYGASLVLMYLASTAYHSVPVRNIRLKQTLRAFDHSAIFVLIAGTYTAFALSVLQGLMARVLLLGMWGLCAAGIFVVWRRLEPRRGPVLLSLTMGWLVALLAPQLSRSLAAGGTLLVVVGGVLYTLGVPFYLWRRLPHHHGIWHVFVLLGSLSHFLAVAWFVLPQKS